MLQACPHVSLHELSNQVYKFLVYLGFLKHKCLIKWGLVPQWDMDFLSKYYGCFDLELKKIVWSGWITHKAMGCV